MKNKTSYLLLLLAVMLPAIGYSQNNNDKSHYLAGAVPEVNGKVVFSKEFDVTGLNKDDIYTRMLSYLTNRMAKNNNEESRIVYTDKDKGVIAASANEWMVFSSSSFALDRTHINYQVLANCSDGKCDVSIERISYFYQDKDKYTAETWISDDIALNKKKTKIYPGLSKWRIKTIDLVDTYFKEIQDSLGVVNNYYNVKTEGAPVVVTQPAQTSTGQTTPVIVTTVNRTSMKSDINILYTSKVLVIIGNDIDNSTIITAKGATVGQLQGKPVVFTYFDASQTTSALNNIKTYTVRFINPDTRAVLKELKCQAIGSYDAQGLHVYEAQIEQ